MDYIAEIKKETKEILERCSGRFKDVIIIIEPSDKLIQENFSKEVIEILEKNNIPILIGENYHDYWGCTYFEDKKLYIDTIEDYYNYILDHVLETFYISYDGYYEGLGY